MLSVVNARKRFGNVVAVRDVSLTIGDGRTFGLLGPNGAGKTTMMRMILGIMAPDGGAIEWNGRSVDERVRLRFGYLPEERGLYGRMRVRDHIIYLGRLHGISKERAASAADEWIARLDLAQYAQRPCAELSKGNQQKVQVACAAVHAPDLLVLDEPFTGLDPVNAGILLDVLADLRRRGTALVLSSHEMWQLERLCDEFCIIAQGTVRARGTLAELRRNWPSRRVRVSPSTPRVRAMIDALPGAHLVVAGEDALTYDLDANTDCAGLLRELVATEAIVSFERIEPSLRDVYLRVIGEAEEH